MNSEKGWLQSKDLSAFEQYYYSGDASRASP